MILVLGKILQIPIDEKVNIDLVPSGNKPLTEPGLTQIYVTIWVTRPQRVKWITLYYGSPKEHICVWNVGLMGHQWAI